MHHEEVCTHPSSSTSLNVEVNLNLLVQIHYVILLVGELVVGNLMVAVFVEVLVALTFDEVAVVLNSIS